MAISTVAKQVIDGIMYETKQESSTGMKYVVAAYAVEKDLIEITIRSSVDGVPVTEVGAGAFAQMPKLKKVLVVENTAISFAGAVFANCPRLEEFYSFATNTSFATQVFKECPNLREVAIFGNAFLLGQNIFDKCPKMTKLTGKIVKVKDFAFGGSSKFERLTFSDNAKFTPHSMVGASADNLFFYGDVCLLESANINMFEDYHIECKKYSMLADLVYEGCHVSFW